MTYLDTNVLVRIITGDNQELASKAITEIESGGQGDFCIIDAVMVELCFILEFHAYAMARTDIVEAVEALIATPQISVSEKTLLTLKLYGEYPKLDYADCLLFVLGGRNGVLTFDKDLQKSLLQ
jgi:predicted nucleic-acid-binding protein